MPDNGYGLAREIDEPPLLPCGGLSDPHTDAHRLAERCILRNVNGIGQAWRAPQDAGSMPRNRRRHVSRKDIRRLPRYSVPPRVRIHAP
jgi:hypothetical protein